MSELETVPETITELQPDGPSDLGAITALIAGDSPEPEQVEAADDAAAPDPELELETEPPEEDEAPPEPVKVDYDQVVAMPDGLEAQTIGQLKDHYQATIDHNQAVEAWEAHRMEQDNQLLVARQALNEFANLIGDVKPEVMAHVQQQRQASQVSEAAALLKVFPEWADPEVKKAATPALLETMQSLGYSEAEFAQIGDHRLIKGLSDLTRLRKAEKAGIERRENIKAVIPKGQKGTQRKQTASQAQRDKLQRARNGTESEKLAAIGSLITGQ